MATNLDDGRLRRYLLGGLPEEQSTVLEEEYVVQEEALERMRAAEYELIDDYLAGQLTPNEREQFDRHYLASPVHQHRVAVARQLHMAANRQVPEHRATSAQTSRWSWLWFEPPFAWKGALAVALVLAIAVGAAWMVRARFETQGSAPTIATGTATQPQASGPDSPRPSGSQPSPVIFAISLSPAGVRSAEDSRPVTIPPGTGPVVVNLESDGPAPPTSQRRAVVNTVSGREVWRGPATSGTFIPAPAFAQIEIPADRLTPDDYIVTLFETRGSGPEVEGFRYFLRIRAR